MDNNTFESSQTMISQPIVSQVPISETDNSINTYILYMFFGIVIIVACYYLYYYLKTSNTEERSLNDGVSMNNELTKPMDYETWFYNLFNKWFPNTVLYIKSKFYNSYGDILNDSDIVNQNISPTQLQTQPIENTIPKTDISTNTPLNKALDKNDKTIKKEYKPDDSHSSSVQKVRSKHGWCKIGETDGVTSCIEVGPNDECMSGEIFPSRDLCVNPKLRG